MKNLIPCLVITILCASISSAGLDFRDIPITGETVTVITGPGSFPVDSTFDIVGTTPLTDIQIPDGVTVSNPFDTIEGPFGSLPFTFDNSNLAAVPGTIFLANGQALIPYTQPDTDSSSTAITYILIPEPASLAILTLGSLILRKRRID
ncbi:hypothetical protein STSP2_00937 [Anaerohalosphaera lusitana]|uniref:PEP-CTERM protein-sorting domain-containing protein n=1 Tax=Anaerohalosphaera lusitana TaxID=1936003 RepID=A0A1U9NJ78_9BACT|nr:hypothetical protein [Anaerohalosphaera lusitana]AQT67788.1 hypothetical protein STSP2_00937 [Anaerohalosphaera lusitana]